MARHYTINKLCKLTSVSVRTLHYYDEIDLLKPSFRTNKGHRLYSESDLLKLQQIVTFRFLGFTLSKIRPIVQADHQNMFNLIKLQASSIAEEAARIDKVSKFFNYLINQYDQHQSIDWKTVANIIEVLNQKDSDTHKWYERYLSSDELPQFQKYAKTRTSKWLTLFEEVRSNLDTDPCGDVGLELVQKWIALADDAYGDHPQLRKKLWEAYQAGMIPNDFFPFDKDVIAYLSQAFDRFVEVERRSQI